MLAKIALSMLTIEPKSAVYVDIDLTAILRPLVLLVVTATLAVLDRQKQEVGECMGHGSVRTLLRSAFLQRTRIFGVEAPMKRYLSFVELQFCFEGHYSHSKCFVPKTRLQS